MPISFTCPHCGKQTSVADQYAGQSGPCRFCGEIITIPATEVPPTLSAAPQPPVKGSGTGATIGVVAVVCVVVLLVCGGVLVALLLPAVQSAGEGARRAHCTNNLKQIGLALQNYHDTHKTFPPAYIPDKDGKPMHSWRVLILPYLEQQSLYERYNFDEPWDSPGNLAVTNTVIPVYSCPSCPPSGDSMGSTETNYMVITGPGTVFDGAKAARLADIKDGTSNTILVVEVVGTGVNWAEPVDLDVGNMQFPNVTGGSTGPDSHHPGGLNAVLCDGSVRFLSEAMDRQVLDALITKGGGEPIGDY
ncbi:MAG: DUF1559 domain-containing protein [Pirellulaceae bacterium]|nr:DUF1559 domain-containing protein [Pirellulaceae bacterium]